MSNVYGPIKLFNYPEHITSLAEGRVLEPIHIRIKPTNTCNHNCWFCAYRVENLELGDEMNIRDQIPEEKMEEIVSDIIKMKVRAVTFSGGGEPLIYKPIAKTVNELGANGVKVATLTNGSFLKGEVASAFAKYGTWVRVSTDAWNDESIRKSRRISKDDFSNICHNIKNFISTGTKCVLGISFVVTQENHEHIYEATNIFKSLGVHHVKISGCVVSMNGKENNSYHAQIKDRVFLEIERAKELNDDNFKIINHYHDMDESFSKSYSSCRFLQFLTVIGADCKVYTCQDKAYSQSGLLGSIEKKSFQEFWFSQENKMKLLSLNPQRDCNHHCVSHCKNLLINEFLELDREHIDFV